MKNRHALVILLAVLTSFFAITLFSFKAIAAPSEVKVIIKVNEEGFYDARGKSFNNRVEVPQERTIKLIFEHVGKPGEKHAFVLLFDSDEEIESGTISDINRTTHIKFNTGKAGEIYDVFCVIVECDGMEHMTDLVIIAV